MQGGGFCENCTNGGPVGANGAPFSGGRSANVSHLVPVLCLSATRTKTSLFWSRFPIEAGRKPRLLPPGKQKGPTLIESALMVERDTRLELATFTLAR